MLFWRPLPYTKKGGRREKGEGSYQSMEIKESTVIGEWIKQLGPEAPLGLRV